MREQEKLVAAKVACAVLAHTQNDGISLVDLDTLPLTPENAMALAAVGARFIGTLCWRDGVSHATVEPDAPDAAITLIEALSRFEEYAIARSKTRDDGLDFLERMALLPDSRPN